MALIKEGGDVNGAMMCQITSQRAVGPSTDACAEKKIFLSSWKKASWNEQLKKLSSHLLLSVRFTLLLCDQCQDSCPFASGLLKLSLMSSRFVQVTWAWFSFLFKAEGFSVLRIERVLVMHTSVGVAGTLWNGVYKPVQLRLLFLFGKGLVGRKECFLEQLWFLRLIF